MGLDVSAAIAWDAWRPLEGCWRGPGVPAVAGLYRIRRCGQEALDYIGQTGMGTMNLRKRLAMLAGVFADEMPYRDPHTVGPALWALRREGCAMEVSVAPVVGTTPWRKGLEALAISLHREAWRCSPTLNFGRMPAGYSMSSHNNARLVREGRRFRGGPWQGPDASHEPGLAPLGLLGGDPQGEGWAGHAWSAWTPLAPDAGRMLPPGNGIYRIRGAGRPGLLYVGEGLVRARLLTHSRKLSDPENEQGQVFAAAAPLECAWVLNESWLHHHRLELENDLIASHLLATGTIPAAQFLG